MRNRVFWLIMVMLMLILAACDDNEDSNGDGNRGSTSPTPTATSELNPVTINPNPGGIQQDTLDLQKVAPGEGRLVLNISMPEGYKFNNLAPFVGEFSSDSSTAIIAEANARLEEIEPKVPIVVPITLQPGEATLTLNLYIYWCEAVNETLCFVDRREVIVPLNVTDDGNTSQAIATIALVPPTVQ